MRALLALSVLVLAVGCGGDSTDNHNHDTGDQDVTTCDPGTSFSITNFAFVPACITISPGQTVLFTNNDQTTHTSSTNAGMTPTWSQNLLAGDTFTSPAISSGTVKGHCNIHTSMHFEIRVE